MLLLPCCILHMNKMRRLQFPVNQCLRKQQHFKKFSLTVASFHLKYGIFCHLIESSQQLLKTVRKLQVILNPQLHLTAPCFRIQLFFLFFPRCRQYILYEFTSSRPDTYSLHCSPSIMCLAIAHTEPWKWETLCECK